MVASRHRTSVNRADGLARWVPPPHCWLQVLRRAASSYRALGEYRVDPPIPRRLTFERGEIRAARFAPDGNTVVYSAEWRGEPPELFTTRLDSRESRPLGLSGHAPGGLVNERARIHSPRRSRRQHRPCALSWRRAKSGHGSRWVGGLVTGWQPTWQ